MARYMSDKIQVGGNQRRTEVSSMAAGRDGAAPMQSVQSVQPKQAAERPHAAPAAPHGAHAEPAADPASVAPSQADDLGEGEECYSLSAQAFFVRHYWLLLVVPYLVVRAWNLYFLSPTQDLQHYFEAGSQFLAGKVAYRDFSCEYPPGALPFFALPKLLASDFAGYQRYFAAEMVAVDLGIMALLALFARRVAAALAGPATAALQPWRFHAAIGQLGYLWLTGSLGYLAFERYDLLFAGCLLAWLVAATSEGKHANVLAALALAASVAIKLVSVVLVPLWLVYLVQLPAAAPGRPVSEPFARRFAATAARPLLAFIAMLTAMVLPFYVAAGTAFSRFLDYHQARGLQFESTGASLLLLLRDLGLTDLGTRFAYGAAEVTHPAVAAMVAWAPLCTVAAVVLVVRRAHERLQAAPTPRAQWAVLASAATATMLLQMGCNKVFSPQYLLWVAPLAGALLCLRAGRFRPALVGLTVAFALTSLGLFFYYGNLLRMERMGIALLVVRNALVWGVGLTLADLGPPAFWRPLAKLAMQRLGRFAHHRWVGTAAVVSAGFWALLANFSETTANDIWIQLRSGEDIIRSGSVPYTEVYSAVVSGRPFIAHEWLCGVFFYLSTLVLGDAGLSVMTALVALGTFCCMYYTCPKEQRSSLWYVPLLLYSTYLVAFRVLARPHIFTIWAQAALILAIEQWRREGGLRRLWWLVPVQIVWINLHGAALFGPALMGMATGLTLVAVLWPSLDATNPRRFGWGDVKDGTLMTVALGLACFVNPYGTRIVSFSVDLLHNEYAKSRVWEWTTPFLQMNTYYYWLWIWLVEMSLLWFGLLLRLRQRPLFDLAYAGLATYLGVRANRFMPDFALLSFPVMARSLHAACKQGLRPAWQGRQPWLELGLTSLLLCNCVVYGYAHSTREHRPLPGWGYGGDMPYGEVALLKKLKVRGTIYNEYSDGSLIINRLWPDIKPVLDSRIDLYPLDLVNDYDTAYVNPQHFAAYLKKRQVNVVMMYRNRMQPGIVQYLETNPQWRRLSDVNNRLLYVTRDSLRRSPS